MEQFRPGITKIRVCTFEMSGKMTDSANVASEPVVSIPFLRYLAALAAKYSKKLRFQLARALTLVAVFRTTLVSFCLQSGRTAATVWNLSCSLRLPWISMADAELSADGPDAELRAE